MDNITDTDILEDIKDDTHAWWLTSDKANTTQYFTSIENALIDLTEFDQDTPFQSGEAKITDLATDTTMDMRKFLDQPR